MNHLSFVAFIEKQRNNSWSEIPASKQCTHPPSGDPTADGLQSIVMETTDGAVVEIYGSPNGYGGLKK